MQDTDEIIEIPVNDAKASADELVPVLMEKIQALEERVGKLESSQDLRTPEQKLQEAVVAMMQGQGIVKAEGGLFLPAGNVIALEARPRRPIGGTR